MASCLLLAECFVELGGRRNEFEHGAMWQTHEGFFDSVAIGVEAEKYAAKWQRFTIEDARILEGEINTLSNDATNFMLRVDRLTAEAGRDAGSA
jgi:hypothetical protein